MINSATSSEKRWVYLDIETNGLNDATRVWCVVTQDLATDDIIVWREPDINNDTLLDLIEYLRDAVVVGHNIIKFDHRWLDELLGIVVPREGVLDTLVLSLLLNQGREGGHSLEAWGKRLGILKGEFSDFTKYSEEMVEYCKQDVRLGVAVYRHLMSIVNRNGDAFTKAIDIEHDAMWNARDLEENGFKFDITACEEMINELDTKLSLLTESMERDFPPRAKLLREVCPRVTKHGTISRSGISNWYDGSDYTIFTEGAPFSLVSWEPFNPASPKQIIDRLWEAGWKPVEKTDGHLDAIKEKKDLTKFEKYGWKINELNISTLPSLEAEKLWIQKRNVFVPITISKTITQKIESALKRTHGKAIIDETIEIDKEFLNDKNFMDYLRQSISLFYPDRTDVAKFVDENASSWSITVTPTGMYVDCSAGFVTDTWAGLKDTTRLQKTISLNKSCQNLIEYILLAARRRTLEEWRTAYNPVDGRIHGRFNPLGARSHRCVHTNPNMGNIAAKKSIKYNTQRLRDLAIHYGVRMRSMWICDSDSWLVGTDMDGAHLRIFAHLIDDQEFIDALVKGKKEDGTDPHSVNMRKFGPICVDRDRAKTAIFTLLNGGAVPKLMSIFGCDKRSAQASLEDFIQSYPGLARLKEIQFPEDADRGFFIGVDGRKVICDSAHLMMGMILQNYESVLMKYANRIWRQRLNDMGITGWKQVNWVHDEFVTEVRGSKDLAILIGQVQSDAIVEVGKMFGLRCPMAGTSIVGKNWLEVH